MTRSHLAGALCVLGCSCLAFGDITEQYNVDAGGNNPNPINGLSASATYSIAGDVLSILLMNDSTGIPLDADTADQLLVSLGFNLPGDITILSGDAAAIGPGSIGLGDWGGRGEGDSVAEQWLWTNDFGGDLMDVFAQIISTSNGQGEGTNWGFDGSKNPNVDGPFGGMAAAPPFIPIPDDQVAVSNSILFTLTLSHTLADDQLAAVARGAIVEYGSDFQYLQVPGPGALPLALVAAVFARRRRRN